jgi:hypothetical protein
MRIRTLGLAALMAGSLMGDGVAQSVQDEIQEDEAPGSEMEMDIEPGRVVIGRQKNLNPSPVEIQGRTLDVPDDPDTPAAEDQVDAELPGEGPEISPVPTTTIRSPTEEFTRRPGWPRRRRPPSPRHRLFRGASSRAA